MEIPRRNLQGNCSVQRANLQFVYRGNTEIINKINELRIFQGGLLTVVDCFSRESLAIHVGQSLKGEDVASVLSRIVGERGKPQTIKSDNGSEFISKVMDK